MSAFDLSPGCLEAADRFQADGKIFIEEILGVDTLEEYHKLIVDTVWKHDRTAIKACHDVGKSFIMARIAIAFLNVYPGSKVITTAPTFTQVERILWSEIRAAVAKSKWPLGGKLNTTDWTHSPDWFALGFTPRNEAGGGEGQGTQSNFQGFHAPHILVLFDEATGIPLQIWNMAEGLMTSAHVKFVAIGNPTSRASEFYRCFKSRDWVKMTLSCFDSPNLIANGITDKAKLEKAISKYRKLSDKDAITYVNSFKVTRPYLITTKWVVQQAAKWGIDHPLTVSKILAEFPKTGEKTLVPLDYVEAAQLRLYNPVESDRKIIAADVAGKEEGSDASVLTGLHGKKQLFRKDITGESTNGITGEILHESREMGGANVIVVDKTGIGTGVVDNLEDEIGKSLPQNCEIRGVHFGSACEDPKDVEMYVNLKARIFGLLRDDLKDDDGLALLNESIYAEELPTINKDYNKKGQLVIESKKEYKRRTGRASTDSSDSLALANFGRYDDIKIGKFKKQDSEQRPTMAGSLKSQRAW